MQIQVGKGPNAQEVSGIVKIGQTMTMILGKLLVFSNIKGKIEIR